MAPQQFSFSRELTCRDREKAVWRQTRTAHAGARTAHGGARTAQGARQRGKEVRRRGRRTEARRQGGKEARTAQVSSVHNWQPKPTGGVGRGSHRRRCTREVQLAGVRGWWIDGRKKTDTTDDKEDDKRTKSSTRTAGGRQEDGRRTAGGWQEDGRRTAGGRQGQRANRPPCCSGRRPCRSLPWPSALGTCPGRPAGTAAAPPRWS
jgi:hypothetical protein